MKQLLFNILWAAGGLAAGTFFLYIEILLVKAIADEFKRERR